MIPAIFWLYLCMFRGEAQQELFFLLAFLNLASGISSSLGVLLTCLLTAGLSLLLAVSKKRPGILVKAAISCVPGAAYMLIYLIASHM